MSFYLFLRGLLAPPALHILLILLGLWLLRQQRALAGGLLIGFSLASLWLMSTPLGAGLLSAGLERDPALKLADKLSWQGSQAIVVIGGGRDTAPEYGGQDVPNLWTASRLRYGAWLYRHTGLPLAVSGGVVRDEKEPEAAVMARSLQQDHVVNVRWQESQSRTTWENAQLTQALLAPEGIRRIVLVTQSLHMSRAKMAFEHAGFEVVAAPVDFDRDAGVRSWGQQLATGPSHFMRSSQALHEYAGLLFYRLRILLD